MRDVGPCAPLRGDYVVGWIKRGPSGVIGSNKRDSQDTVDTLIADLGTADLAGYGDCDFNEIRIHRTNFIGTKLDHSQHVSRYKNRHVDCEDIVEPAYGPRRTTIEAISRIADP